MKKKTTIKELQDEGLVTTADKVKNPYITNFEFVVPEGSYFTQDKPLVEFLKDKAAKIDTNWHTEIEDYCSTAGILPSDLINLHRSMNKGLTGLKSGKKVEIQDLTKENSVGKPYKPQKDHSNWNEQYRNKKLGINP